MTSIVKWHFYRVNSFRPSKFDTFIPQLTKWDIFRCRMMCNVQTKNEAIKIGNILARSWSFWGLIIAGISKLNSFTILHSKVSSKFRLRLLNQQNESKLLHISYFKEFTHQKFFLKSPFLNLCEENTWKRFRILCTVLLYPWKFVKIHVLLGKLNRNPEEFYDIPYLLQSKTYIYKLYIFTKNNIIIT
jgi:hypothetical protein